MSYCDSCLRPNNVHALARQVYLGAAVLKWNLGGCCFAMKSCNVLFRLDVDGRKQLRRKAYQTLQFANCSLQVGSIQSIHILTDFLANLQQSVNYVLPDRSSTGLIR